MPVFLQYRGKSNNATRRANRTKNEKEKNSFTAVLWGKHARVLRNQYVRSESKAKKKNKKIYRKESAGPILTASRGSERYGDSPDPVVL